jgi:uncharacterized protein YbgA (DUF1722 family)/uncharacterized protein YbbK (DUF523 family)
MGDARFSKPRVGISSCLLGNQVRFDGQHKRDRYLTDTFGQFVEWVPVCPEVECGLSTPRESMHLEGDPKSPRLVTTKTGTDYTERMQRWAEARLDQLEQLDLCGFIFKTNSPSSGMRSIRVYNDKGIPHKVGVGLFAKALMERFPLLPVEDEGRLHDAGLRENFIDRLFALKRYRDTERSVAGLVDFHARHKMQLMAHSENHMRRMGRLVAEAKKQDPETLYQEYERLLLECLSHKTTLRRNANVLTHMLGFFKEQLTADEKAEMLEVIERYGAGLVPLVVPVTLMTHYVRKYDEPYLKSQTFLNPHPVELKLRNHA